MAYRFLISLIFLLILTGCSYKQPVSSRGATIIFKTPTLKFYDKGFIERYEDRVRLTVLNLGTVAVDMTIYEDRVCKNVISCYDGDTFNDTFLDKSYEKDFLYNLLIQDDIYFKDQKNGILIKVIYDTNEDIESNGTK